jgi:hypothetical protein
MTDRSLPVWLKIVLVVMAVMQLIFGVTLLIDPSALTSMWPWPMTAVTTRLLGASTLVSVPLALLSAWFDRFSAARIPLVMILTYRVLQVAAGLVHFSQFDLTSPTTWNYFGGGGLVLIVLAIALARGAALGQPVSDAHPLLRGEALLNLGSAGKTIFQVVGVLFLLLGVQFFALGHLADFLWFEAGGNLTSLTARLFASPMLGLGLALWLIARAGKWRQVAVPGVGMITFGVAGLLTLLLESASIQPPTPLGYLIVATPLILLAMGAYLLMPARSATVK